MINDVSFNPAALYQLKRVDAIPSADGDDASYVKQAFLAALNAGPDARLVHLKVRGLNLIFHYDVEGETAHITDIELAS